MVKSVGVLGAMLGICIALAGCGGTTSSHKTVVKTPVIAPTTCGEGPFNVVAEIPQPTLEHGTLVTSSAQAMVTISGPRVPARPRVWVNAVPSSIQIDNATEFDTTFNFKVGLNTIVIARGRQCQQFSMRLLNAAQIAKARAVAAAKARVAARLKAAAEAKALAAAKARAAARSEAAAEAKEQFEASATTIPYADLIKSTGPYLGEKIKLYGQILQIQQSGSGGFMLLSVTDEGSGLWVDNVWVNYTGTNQYVDNNIITVYGTVTGTKSYTTQVGGETYVPEVSAKYLEGS